MIMSGYRDLYVLLGNEAPEVLAEMRASVALLYDWRKYDPVIAGGALWSWAAGRRCRDLDVFMKNSWGARRRARALCGLQHEDPMLNTVKRVDHYTGGSARYERQVTVYRYATNLRNV